MAKLRKAKASLLSSANTVRSFSNHDDASWHGPLRLPLYFCLSALAIAVGSGCSSMKLSDTAQLGPAFDFVEYFEGHTRASGWFADRFGRVKRHFCGDFVGTKTNDVLSLDEKLIYSDGIEETRIWDVVIDGEGNFSAESDSLVGPATGRISGNALNMQYVMNVLVAPEKTWQLGMDDFMFLQPDGSLHNITIVKKWGVRIGSVSTQYTRHDGSDPCSVKRKRTGYSLQLQPGQLDFVRTKKVASANGYSSDHSVGIASNKVSS